MNSEPRTRGKSLDLDLPDLDQDLNIKLDPIDIWIPLSVVRDSKTPALCKIVYGVLWSFCGAKKKTCSPSLIEIAERSGISLPNIPRTLKVLEARGYIEIDRTGKRNEYKFLKP